VIWKFDDEMIPEEILRSMKLLLEKEFPEPDFQTFKLSNRICGAKVKAPALRKKQIGPC
jgi:hypothetical protein